VLGPPVQGSACRIQAVKPPTRTARLTEALQGRLIFGRTKQIRVLPPGPHAGRFTRQPLHLERPDGTVLEGWSSRPTDGAIDGVVLYFGGRNENVAWAPDMASWLPRHAIYAFNYRGFGGSTGKPSERAAKADALALHEWIAAREDAAAMGRLAVVGRSLGTALAMWVAHHVHAPRIVLMCPFESVVHVLHRRPLGWALTPFLNQVFDSTRLARAYPGQALVLLAEADRAVPHRHSRRLGERLPNAPTTQVVPGTTHKTLPRSPGAQAAIAAFLGRAASPDD
jgi:pimeloyl-ACP methyl ester carboxylesterase